MRFSYRFLRDAGGAGCPRYRWGMVEKAEHFLVSRRRARLNVPRVLLTEVPLACETPPIFENNSRNNSLRLSRACLGKSSSGCPPGGFRGNKGGHAFRSHQPSSSCSSRRSLQKNGRLFEPFVYKNEHFTKTGSGQT